MALSEKRKASQKAYNQRTFDMVGVRIPKGDYQGIKDNIEKAGYTSINQFFVDAIEEKIAGGVHHEG